MPLLAALVPVLRGTHITVREAVTSYGLTERSNPNGLIDRALTRLRGLPRPVLLSLGNTFRRRGRLALTLATLTLGGALFASVTTVQSSLEGTLDQVLQYSTYDVQLSLDEPATGRGGSARAPVPCRGWSLPRAGSPPMPRTRAPTVRRTQTSG